MAAIHNIPAMDVKRPTVQLLPLVHISTIGQIACFKGVSQWRQQQPGVDNKTLRPMPQHFALAFAILGWRESSWYFRCSWRVTCRLVSEVGKAQLLKERAAMRSNPIRHKLKAQMAAYWTSEPHDPVWVQS